MANLKGMNVEALMGLRNQVDKRLLECRAEIEKQLAAFPGPSRLLKMQLKWHWLRVGVVYEFKALPTLPFGSLLSFKRLLRSTWAT